MFGYAASYYVPSSQPKKAATTANTVSAPSGDKAATPATTGASSSNKAMAAAAPTPSVPASRPPGVTRIGKPKLSWQKNGDRKPADLKPVAHSAAPSNTLATGVPGHVTSSSAPSHLAGDMRNGAATNSKSGRGPVHHHTVEPVSMETTAHDARREPGNVSSRGVAGQQHQGLQVTAEAKLPSLRQLPDRADLQQHQQQKQKQHPSTAAKLPSAASGMQQAATSTPSTSVPRDSATNPSSHARTIDAGQSAQQPLAQVPPAAHQHKLQRKRMRDESSAHNARLLSGAMTDEGIARALQQQAMADALEGGGGSSSRTTKKQPPSKGELMRRKLFGKG